ncbi:MAG: amylo-alpha-1,6-glucosidase [Bacteroidota bacterium]
MPKASAFLWNEKMMIQVNCRGFATAQHMQPEPAKYAYAPNLEAKTFMQPEQAYYAHHPGRFFYIKDEETGSLFSAPYEPCRAQLDAFKFIANASDVKWIVKKDGIEIELCLSLAKDQPIELWTIAIKNRGSKNRKLSVYPFFTIGYMSWMNQSCTFDHELNAIVANCVTPYQKYPDYFKQKDFKDKTYLLADRRPDAYELQREQFEGEGGLQRPDAVLAERLNNSDARYETPAAVMQYTLSLSAGDTQEFRFLFGPAKDTNDIKEIKKQFFSNENLTKAKKDYHQHLTKHRGLLKIETPDQDFDHFVNHWLGRQVYYHGDVNRLTTDPQTRNYLQDNMGMSYLSPTVARAAFLNALSQQERSGAMPDGILLIEQAELKYINQVPHTDHCVWLPICLQAYLDETNDYELLEESVGFKDSEEQLSVAEHIHLAMRWLVQARDHRGLNLIDQGDWCDPMNMVGYKGKGVSGWLTLATAYALKCWARICIEIKAEAKADAFLIAANECNASVNKHIWEGQWYGRGITDDDVLFGTRQDDEGQIFLNPQAWALLAEATNTEQQKSIIEAVESKLETPYGVELLTPSFTAMREDVGRVTQKHPGTAENGSVYNHAAAFYIYALYKVGKPDKAFELLRKMIPGPTLQDYLQRGQLPLYIPNYYRGAYRQFPSRAGRSSQLFNTGTVHWFYRCLIDGLIGLKGVPEGLLIDPKMPTEWNEMKASRKFRNAQINMTVRRDRNLKRTRIQVDGNILDGHVLTITDGETYELLVEVA